MLRKPFHSIALFTLLSASVAGAQTETKLPTVGSAQATPSQSDPTKKEDAFRNATNASPPHIDVLYTSLQVARKTTYLGIGVEAPGDTLRSQLNLNEGAALVVNYVDPNSPSKDLIHPHDVLQKIDDQILFNAEQFQALVHMHKIGQTVKVTLIREAKPVSIDIKLGEKETAALMGVLENESYRVTYGRLAADINNTGTSKTTLNDLYVMKFATTAPTTKPGETLADTMGLYVPRGTLDINHPVNTLAPLDSGGAYDLVVVRPEVRLASQGLAATLIPPDTQPADRATAIHRLMLNLTGAAPTPDEVKAFVDDKSPDAYEKLVQRLLASTPTTIVRPLDATPGGSTSGSPINTK